MSRTNLVILLAIICATLMAHVQSRNLAMTGGIPSIFNIPFRVVGKRNELHGPYKEARFDVPQARPADLFEY